MSAIDVLGVMHREARCLASFQPRESAEMLQAHAAVAELIAAATSVNLGFDEPDGVSIAAADRLHAALARCTGETP